MRTQEEAVIAKLQIDVRKWSMEKDNKKYYGEDKGVTSSGTPMININIGTVKSPFEKDTTMIDVSHDGTVVDVEAKHG